jgi:hypothetical protein
MVAIATTTNAQYFNEVKIDGSSTEYLAKIKAKGYVFKKYFDNNNGAILMKDLNELYVFWTPKTKLVYKVSIYFPKKDGWYSLKSQYGEYKDMLSNKYGEPKDVYEYFTKPYYEGDGYEMTALSVGKVSYFSFWDLSNEQNLQLGLSITKYDQVEISYENYKNTLLKNQEQNAINSKVF